MKKTKFNNSCKNFNNIYQLMMPINRNYRIIEKNKQIKNQILIKNFKK